MFVMTYNDVIHKQSLLYLQCQFENVDQLKLALEAKRNTLSQTFINKSIDKWRQRLEAVKNNGRH